MTNIRNAPDGSLPDGSVSGEGVTDDGADVTDVAPRALSARSVVASTLLGASPPELPIATIVRCGALFDIGPGTVRTAVSRMVADGSLTVDPDRSVYRIGGGLLARHRRQTHSRHPTRRPWDGSWMQWVVTAPTRTAADRSALRASARALHMAEVREGVWMRPNNLDSTLEGPQGVAASQCLHLEVRPHGDAAALAATLWDLAGWDRTARALLVQLDRHGPVLDATGDAALADGFMLSAAVLRHLLADPLLPDELVPDDWPGHNLRSAYDLYDASYKEHWRNWFRQQSSRSANTAS
jgi:phenylacetic acid degradation operon negative regulatory protein